VLFTADAWPGLADGSITLTFRRWKRPQARVGGRYRIAGVILEVLAVDLVPTGSITYADAVRAGAASRTELIERLGGAAEDVVTRVEFRCVGPDDRIARRAATDDAAEITAIRQRLARLDRGAAGPWTEATLRLIARYPGVVSTALARHVDMERAVFKTKVRSLKELGLTESLETGYRLSSRGVAVLASFSE
jgi:hypothetical protein